MWQPIIAGILTILSAFLGGWAFLQVYYDIDFVYRLLVAIAVVLIISSTYASFMRKHWRVALTGAICSICAFPVFPFFGIAAVILVVTGKHKFR